MSVYFIYLLNDINKSCLLQAMVKNVLNVTSQA